MTVEQQNHEQVVKKKKRQFKMLSAFSILLIIIAVLVLISWILKWSGVQVKVEGKETAIVAVGIFDLFKAPMQGFIDRAEIIIFVLCLGAFINIVVASQALEGFSQSIVAKMKGKEIWAIIPLMLFFGICGTAEGMAEESLGFYMICIPLMVAAGFDKFTGLLIVLVGAGTGVLASTVNPFSIGVAVDSLNKAGKQLTDTGDGLVWRLVSFITLMSISITMVMLYAKKVKNNPAKSIVFKTLEEDKKFFLTNSTEKIEMNWRRKLTISVFGIAFLIMIFYLVGWDKILGNRNAAIFAEWVRTNIPYLTGTDAGFGGGGLESVAAIFLISSIVLAIINSLGEEKFIKEFMTGACDLLGVCLVIAVAGGVTWILKETHMQELFVTGLESSIGAIQSPILILLVMFILFIPLSFLIPSTSGFAGAVFPLLAGIVTKDQGVLASGSITAFSFASGLVNLITPTSGVVMGAVAIARMDYAKFLKGIAPFLGVLAASSLTLLLIGGAIGGPIA
ncbi:putative ion transporter superfamily protein YfcC [Mycoplasma yeatsii]|uniref:Ion transporter superfamily protein YfcC n=2 Tax=Mycoplasma yeatsii TaxID=51365 RepID=A0ABU0NDG3_9MOLU|nr:YfcC family protein [Mycoplasma yeatsii]MDQ0567489.1 putative ion transporter superfamily protein YfcC [Mycoplasma yeatsii]